MQVCGADYGGHGMNLRVLKRLERLEAEALEQAARLN
jgi:hypothetical protein